MHRNPETSLVLRGTVHWLRFWYLFAISWTDHLTSSSSQDQPSKPECTGAGGLWTHAAHGPTTLYYVLVLKKASGSGIPLLTSELLIVHRCSNTASIPTSVRGEHYNRNALPPLCTLSLTDNRTSRQYHKCFLHARRYFIPYTTTW